MKVKLRLDKQGNKGYYILDAFEGYYVDEKGKKKAKRDRELRYNQIP